MKPTTVCSCCSLNFGQTDLFRVETLDRSGKHGAGKVRQGVVGGGLYTALACKETKRDVPCSQEQG